MLNITSKLIPGSDLAKAKKSELQKLISENCKEDSRPGLKIIQVGDDAASTLYVNLKVNTAKSIGMNAEAVNFAANTNLEEIKNKINEFNNDNSVHGIIVQAPIMGADDQQTREVFNTIAPQKDVDGLSIFSLGRVWHMENLSELNQPDFFISATPLAVLDCLLWVNDQMNGSSVEMNVNFAYNRFINLENLISSKRILIVNSSIIVGKPLAAILTAAKGTVTIAHEHTQNLGDMVKDFDIIMTATGVDGLFKLEQFNSQQIVLDVGINNNNPDQKIRGDVNIDNLNSADQANLPILAPVPGGVGPLTVINLLYNTYLSYIKTTPNNSTQN